MNETIAFTYLCKSDYLANADTEFLYKDLKSVVVLYWFLNDTLARFVNSPLVCG